MARAIFGLAFILTCVFAYMRMYVVEPTGLHEEDIFKDMAHLFIGSLFGGAVVASCIKIPVSLEELPVRYERHPVTGSLWVMFVFLTGVEVFAFFTK